MDLYNTNKTDYNKLGGQIGGSTKKKKMHLKKMLPKELLIGKGRGRAKRMARMSKTQSRNIARLADNVDADGTIDTDTEMIVGNMTEFCDQINKKYVMKKKLDFFVGKCVFIGLNTDKKTGYPEIEWIWVKINSADTTRKCLIGTIDVVPQYVAGVKFGDQIDVEQKDIGMIQITDLVNFFMGLIDEMKEKDPERYYRAIWDYIKNSNSNGDFYK
jgi:hypothetical protein